MAASSEASTDSGHSEDINVFAPVLANIRLDRLPPFATSVRELFPRTRFHQYKRAAEVIVGRSVKGVCLRNWYSDFAFD